MQRFFGELPPPPWTVYPSAGHGGSGRSGSGLSLPHSSLLHQSPIANRRCQPDLSGGPQCDSLCSSKEKTNECQNPLSMATRFEDLSVIGAVEQWFDAPPRDGVETIRVIMKDEISR